MSNEENLASTFPIKQQNLELNISEEMVKSESFLKEVLSYFDSNLLEGWCYYGTETKLIFIHTNLLTRKEDICFSLINNFSVKVSFSQRPEMIVNDTLTSVYDIKNYMRKLQKTILCEGTGIYYRSFAQKCTGQVSINSRHSRQMPRCIWCRTLRKKLIMRNYTNVTQITIEKAREVVEKYKKRYNQLVQKKGILNRELIRTKENAQRSEELLRSVISELPDSKKLSILEYLNESKLENKDISNHSLELFREQDLSKLANHHKSEHSHNEIPENFVDCGTAILIKKEDILYSEEEVEEEKVEEEGEKVEEEGEKVEEEEDEKVVEEEDEKVEEEGVYSELIEKDVSLGEKPLKMPILEIKPLTSKRVAISVLQRDKSESGTVNKYYSIIQLSDEEMYERIEKLKNEDFFLNASYKCESCVFTFKDENELDTHYNDLHLPKPRHVQCSICSMFISYWRLCAHKATHRLLYKCSTCGFAACVGNMLRHLSEHSVPIAKLNNLKRSALLLNPSLKYNRKKMDSKKEYGYNCSECNKCFEKQYLRYRHVLKCHREGFECKTCGKTFALKDTLNKHLKVHSPYFLREECPICHTMVRSDRVKAHAKIHSDRQQFHCNICNKKFVSNDSFEKHFRNAKVHAVRDVLKYKCDHCSKGFRTMTHLKDHINYNHMGRTEYKCPVCNKALATRRGVTRHVRRAHQGLKEWVGDKMICQICGKTFIFIKMRKRNKNKTYGAAKIKKKVLVDNLIRAREACRKRKAEMQQVQQVNSPNENIDSNLIKNKKSLVEHEMIHTGEKPLSCDICSRSFRQKAGLYTHRRRVHNVPVRGVIIHTGDDE